MEFLKRFIRRVWACLLFVVVISAILLLAGLPGILAVKLNNYAWLILYLLVIPLFMTLGEHMNGDD